MHKINKKHIKDFSAHVVAFDYQSMQVSNVYTDSLIPILVRQGVKPKKYSLVMDFVSQQDISRFLAEAIRKFELRIDDGYVYHCYLDDTPSVQQEGVCSFTLTLSLLVLQRGEEHKISLKTGDNLITVNGTYDVGIRYEIVPRNNGDITIGGYTIRNIRVGKKIILDGENKVILEEGKNKYSDAMFTKFPSLSPGNHIVEVSGANADIVMYYIPIYL